MFKRFLRKRWLGLPIGIIATALIGTAVLAAILVTAIQTITQEIVEKPIPPPTDSIIAEAIALPKVYAGHTFTWNAVEPVTVVTAEADRIFNAVLADPTAYSAFSVELVLATKPVDSGLVVGTTTITVGTGALTDSLVLDVIGEYIFTQTVAGTAGGIGSASTDLTLTIDDGL